MPSEVERLRRNLEVLSSAIAAFSQATIDYRRLLATVVRQMAEVIQDSCVMLLRGPDGDLFPGAIYDPDQELMAELVMLYARPLGPGMTYTRQAMETGQGMLFPQLDLESVRGRVTTQMYDLFKRIGLQGSLLVPMRVAGQPFGVVTVLRHRPHHRPLDELDLELASDLANHAALAIANAQQIDALKENEQLRRAQAEVERANRFLDAIVEHIPDMIFVKDAERLAFTRFNRAGEELIGVPREQMLGKTDYDFFPPEEAVFFQQKDRETLLGKKLIEIPEEPIETARGRRWLHTKKVPILDELGIPRYLLGISQDITELKQHQAELVAAKDRAESANKELEAFSYSVAHDLRAPLRGIDGFSQALLDDYGNLLDGEGHRMLGRVRECAQRMATLIDDLLALSRVTRQALRRERVDLSALAAASLAQLQRANPERAVETVVPPGLSVVADPGLLGIALENLLGNAWKFTSRTPNPRIELGYRDEDGERRYFVRDNGAGFDPQYAHKLFGVFQRLHTETEFPGTGIGLATVARIVARHRGRVWAEGSPGGGAAFYFTIGEPEVV